MNDKLSEYGKATQFTSTNQPSPEKKRVKKYKLWSKKTLLKHLPALEKELEKGNVKAFEVVKEWGYGKEVDKVEVNSTNKTIIEILVEELSKNNEIPKDN
jgi:hypothetical protein